MASARSRIRAVWLVVSLLAISLSANAPPAMDQLLRVRVPMRDGIGLDTNVFLPLKASKLPVILIRTPYNKGRELLPSYWTFVEHGFGVVVQDVRGRYGSEGVFLTPQQEVNDGDDTINWIVRQRWSDGNVGMLGGSYVGITQWKAALSGNSHLKAISPVVSGGDEYRDRFYSPGGALKLGHRLQWMAENLRTSGYQTPSFSQFVRHVPLRTSDLATTGATQPLFQHALNHPTYDAWWKAQSTLEHISRVKAPVLSVAGWYDNYVQSDLEAFSALQKLNPQHRIVVGPWPHNMSERFAGVEFGRESMAPIRRYQLEWFNQWLRPGHSPVQPAKMSSLNAPIHLFVMGINQWRDEQEWPLARARMTPMYLHGNGKANSAAGDGGLSVVIEHRRKPDQFDYDPRNPVPTAGGAICCNPKVFPWGPMDQRPVERRDDVLVYTSAPLVQDTEVTGPIQLVLYVSTSAPDTDFTAKLVDLFPDGEARNLTDGILRMRYWHSLSQPEKITPGQVYPIRIDLGVTSNVFRAGHRIRLEVSSSNFPRFDRNPNTGKPIADETKFVTAHQTVFHDRTYPSHLLLPLVPSGNGRFAARLTSDAATRYLR